MSGARAAGRKPAVSQHLFGIELEGDDTPLDPSCAEVAFGLGSALIGTLNNHLVVAAADSSPRTPQRITGTRLQHLLESVEEIPVIYANLPGSHTRAMHGFFMNLRGVKRGDVQVRDLARFITYAVSHRLATLGLVENPDAPRNTVFTSGPERITAPDLRQFVKDAPQLAGPPPRSTEEFAAAVAGIADDVAGEVTGGAVMPRIEISSGLVPVEEFLELQARTAALYAAQRPGRP